MRQNTYITRKIGTPFLKPFILAPAVGEESHLNSLPVQLSARQIPHLPHQDHSHLPRSSVSNSSRLASHICAWRTPDVPDESSLVIGASMFTFSKSVQLVLLAGLLPSLSLATVFFFRAKTEFLFALVLAQHLRRTVWSDDVPHNLVFASCRVCIPGQEKFTEQK